jgi:hypothetical protein
MPQTTRSVPVNKTTNTIIAIVGVIVIGFGLVYFGAVLSRYGLLLPVGQSNTTNTPHYSMIETHGNFSFNRGAYGMMRGWGMTSGSMGSFYSNWEEAVEPLSLTEVDQVVHKYLESFQSEDLILGEIMIFNNHAYAQIVEQSTGVGAMEVLIDPISFAVFPEHGPNMMWNLKYGHIGSYPDHDMGGMMYGFGNDNFTAEYDVEMPISAENAIELAQRYLDQVNPGTQADHHADPFYGYYTIHILQDGDILGMLSVNGFSGDVFLHTWHGDFIEMSEEH